jgi:hypothetical protein
MIYSNTTKESYYYIPSWLAALQPQYVASWFSLSLSSNLTCKAEGQCTGCSNSSAKSRGQSLTDIDSA